MNRGRWRVGCAAVLALALLGLLAASLKPDVGPELPTPAPAAGSAAAPVAPLGDPVEPAAAEGPVDCEITVSLVGRVPRAVELAPATNEPAGDLTLTVDGLWIQFQPRFAEGVGVLYVAGYQPAAFAWMGGACVRPIELERGPVATVRGIVRGLGGASSDYWVAGCRWGAEVEPDGSYVLELGTEEPCEVQVLRVFGASDLYGPEVLVQPRFGAEVVVDLDAPTLPTGPGWDLMEVDDGFRVMAVAPESPAARAGIRVSDRVVEVDGAPAEDLDASGLDELPLELLVDGEGGLREVLLRDE